MIDTCAFLLCDTYKTVHERLYKSDIAYFTSYLVPRKSLFKFQNKMVFFGLQAFLKEWLLDYFNKNFFKKNKEEVIAEYKKYLNIQLGQDNYNVKHLEALHDLQYLPLKILAVPEGSYIPMKTPIISVTNTVPGYHWLVQWIECILQNEIWKISNHATISLQYYKLFEKYYKKTTDNADPHQAASDFGMRGMSCIDEALRCSSAWLLLFNKTSTIGALPWLDKYYDADCSLNKIGQGAASLEHSVISSSFALGEDEASLLKRLLTKSFPNTSFSFVSDTYDYWNVIRNVLPNLKKEIMEHNGKLLIRPDSGDQVSIVVDTVKELWNIFGGTENKKGYKILNPHIGVILGDGCTLNVVESILDKLDKIKFAANNVAFGVGAFCFTASFENNKMIINTRDTFGISQKSTWLKTKGYEEQFVFKDPKTDTDNLKKSYKGLCHVKKLENGDYLTVDGLTKERYDTRCILNPDYLRLVFEDGNLYNQESFIQIRQRLLKEIMFDESKQGENQACKIRRTYS